MIGRVPSLHDGIKAGTGWLAAASLMTTPALADTSTTSAPPPAGSIAPSLANAKPSDAEYGVKTPDIALPFNGNTSVTTSGAMHFTGPTGVFENTVAIGTRGGMTVNFMTHVPVNGAGGVSTDIDVEVPARKFAGGTAQLSLKGTARGCDPTLTPALQQSWRFGAATLDAHIGHDFARRPDTSIGVAFHLPFRH